MPRFICTHSTTALQKFVLPSGRVLAFDYCGVLDTDEEGARVIRADPLCGRLILEGDGAASAHAEVPPLGTPPAVVRERLAARLAGPRPDPRGIAVVKVPCVICGRLFVPGSLGGGQRYCGRKCRRAASEQGRTKRPKTRLKRGRNASKAPR